MPVKYHVLILGASSPARATGMVKERSRAAVSSFGGKCLYGVTFLADDVSPPLYTEMEAGKLTLVARNGQPG